MGEHFHPVPEGTPITPSPETVTEEEIEPLKGLARQLLNEQLEPEATQQACREVMAQQELLARCTETEKFPYFAIKLAVKSAEAGDITTKTEATKFIAKHLLAVQERSFSGSTHPSDLICEGVATLRRFGDETSRSVIMAVLQRGLTSDTPLLYARALHDFGLSDQSADRTLAFVTARRVRAEGMRGHRGYSQFLAEALISKGKNSEAKNALQTEAIQELEKHFRDWELDGLHLEFLYDWRSSDRERRRQSLQVNLERMLDLEAKAPGAVASLYREFGIKCFGRYPIEVLQQQYAERDNRVQPYGIVIYPQADWNGAFYQSYELDNLRSQLNQLGYLMRITECETKQQVARRLISFERRYGQISADGAVDREGHQIAFAMIGGHGTTSEIAFGQGKHQRELLRLSDVLEGKGVQRTKQFFEPGATIILKSCSTGVRGGIAHRISQLTGGTVIAPNQPTSIKSIEATKGSDGQLVFRVEYGGDNVTQQFVGGRPTKDIVDPEQPTLEITRG